MRRGLEIRIATPADQLELVRLATASTRALSVGYSRAQIAAFLDVHGATDARLVRDGTCYVAVVGGTLAGCGAWSFRARLLGGDRAIVSDDREEALEPGRNAARIRSFFVHPDFARRGIGRRLLEHCENAALGAGFTRARLQATIAGRPLYEGAGYRVVRREDVAVPGVPALPSYLMEKALSGPTGRRTGCAPRSPRRERVVPARGA